MPTKPATEVDPVAHVLGLRLRTDGRAARVRGWLLVALGFAAWAGFFWWMGWGRAVIGELIAMGFAAVWVRLRRAARRDWARIRALAVRTRILCPCDQCQRLRAEEIAAQNSEPLDRVES